MLYVFGKELIVETTLNLNSDTHRRKFCILKFNIHYKIITFAADRRGYKWRRSMREMPSSKSRYFIKEMYLLYYYRHSKKQ